MTLEKKIIIIAIIAVCAWISVVSNLAWGSKGMLFPLVFGGIWVWSVVQSIPWLKTLCFLTTFLSAAIGLLADSYNGSFVTGAILALVIWDIDRLFFRLQAADLIQNGTYLLQQHFLRLGGILGGSVLILLITFQLEFTLRFWYAIPLLLLVFFGLQWLLQIVASRDR